MKKRIVLYKRLSDDLMARLQDRVEVTWVDTTALAAKADWVLPGLEEGRLRCWATR